jgi:hypothetical protein
MKTVRLGLCRPIRGVAGAIAILALAAPVFSGAAEAQRRRGASRPSSPGIYFPNCAAARAAGAAPIYRGQPGYRPALDRDNDGVACEARRR